MKKIVFLGLILLVFFGAIQAKQYGLDKALLFYSIKPDGSIAVTLDLTYWFSGSFSTAWITIPQEDFIITNPSVSEIQNEKEIPYSFYRETPEMVPSTFDFTQDGREYRLAWFYRATDTRKTFRLRYEILKGLKVYEDIAEFYFKVWGSDWEIRLPALWVEVILPVQIVLKEEVIYWLHPKIEGQIGVAKDFNKIIAYAGNIPAKQWVEVRILFPRSYLQQLDLSKIILKSGPGKEKILQEEESFKMKEAKRQRLYQFFSFAIKPLAAIIIIFGLFIPLRTYFRYGREPRVHYELEYEREVPEGISPAQADMLLSQQKTVSARAILASTLELAQQGFLKIEEVEREGFLGKKIKDYRIILTGKTESKELKDELNLLFHEWKELASQDGILISELKRKNLTSFKSQFDKKVKKTVYESRGWINSQGEKALMIWSLVCFLSMVVSFLALLFSGLLPNRPITLLLPGTLFLNFLISLFFRKAVRQYSPEGKLIALRLKALKKFLKDFSLITQYPPASLVIWEKYLVFGTILGVAKEVLRAMKELKIPVDSITWFSPAVSSTLTDFNSAFESFNSSLHSFSQAFSTAVAPSTRTGSSDGGGGGAGGGGGGAR